MDSIKFKKIRLGMGMSQEELVPYLSPFNVGNVKTISFYENGHSKIPSYVAVYMLFLSRVVKGRDNDNQGKV